MSTQGSARRTWWKSSRIRRGRHRLVDGLERLLAPLVVIVARTWAYTLRVGVRWSASGPLPDFLDREEPVVLCFWHQDALPSMAYFVTQWAQRRGTPFTLMVGEGRMGRLAGAALRSVAGTAVSGDTQSGETRSQVVDQLARACTETRSCAVLTGDGSRGPAFQVRWGAVRLARETGFPIIAIRTVHSCGLELRFTWPRLRLPPFPGRGYAHAASSEPLYVPADAAPPQMAELRTELERRMRALIPIADAHMTGVVPPTVASPS